MCFSSFLSSSSRHLSSYLISYDRITSNDPLWGSAKIVAALGGTGMAAKPSDLSGALKFLFHRLNLTDRLVPNTGWLAKNKKVSLFY